MGGVLRRACALLPALAQRPVIRTWTGARPATADGLPLLGRRRDGERVWCALGLEGLGLTLGPAVAELLTAEITGGTPALDLRPFSPSRPANLTAASHG
jgi:glycine/D-amino acid oxidase-like deaminating enzyme